MKGRKLGKSDIIVSEIALGCWAFGDKSYWGDQDDNDSINTVSAALDSGINFFDTAEGYGNGMSEEILGKALKNRRDKAIVATKVSSNTSSDKLITSCESSLKRLGTNYIDLYQVHWPNREIPFNETMETMQKLKSEGKIRAIGVCNFGKNDLSDILKSGGIDSNQVAYSLLWRAIEYEVKPECDKNGIGIICYSSLAQKLLTGIYKTAAEVPEVNTRIKIFSSKRPGAMHEDNPGCEEEAFKAIAEIRQLADDLGETMASLAIAWLLHQKDVVTVLAGARKPDEIIEDAKASRLKLTDETIIKLDEITDMVKQKMGPNPDMWLSRMK